MELCRFWVVSPADGETGKPEPIKLVFFENGDIDVISLSDDPEFRGAYKLPSGSYYYSGDTLKVPEENLSRVVPLVPRAEDEACYRSSLFSAGLLNQQEWELFYNNRAAWKSLRIMAVIFGEE